MIVDALARVSFFETSDGGIKRPIIPNGRSKIPKVGVYFKKDESTFSGWIILLREKEIVPGQIISLPLVFLKPEVLIPLLSIGSKVSITFGQAPVAEAEILELFDRRRITFQ